MPVFRGSYPTPLQDKSSHLHSQCTHGAHVRPSAHGPHSIAFRFAHHRFPETHAAPQFTSQREPRDEMPRATYISFVAGSIAMLADSTSYVAAARMAASPAPSEPAALRSQLNEIAHARAGSRSMQSEITHPSEISASHGPRSGFPFADPANQDFEELVTSEALAHGHQHQPPRRNLADFAAERAAADRDQFSHSYWTMPVEFCLAGASNGTGAANLKTSCLISHRSLPVVFAQAPLT